MSLLHLSQFSILLPVFSGLLFYKRLSSPFKLLLLFFVLCIGMEYGAAWIGNHYKNNMPLLHAYTLIEICVYCYIYSLIFNGNRTFVMLSKIFMLIQLLMSIADATLVDRVLKFPTLARTTGAFILIFLSLQQFYILFNHSSDPYLLKKGKFWLLFGVLTYFSTIIFFLLMMNLSLKDNETFRLIHDFHAAMNILCNFIFAYSFLCFRFKQD